MSLFCIGRGVWVVKGKVFRDEFGCRWVWEKEVIVSRVRLSIRNRVNMSKQ